MACLITVNSSLITSNNLRFKVFIYFFNIINMTDLITDEYYEKYLKNRITNNLDIEDINYIKRDINRFVNIFSKFFINEPENIRKYNIEKINNLKFNAYSGYTRYFTSFWFYNELDNNYYCSFNDYTFKNYIKLHEEPTYFGDSLYYIKNNKSYFINEITKSDGYIDDILKDYEIINGSVICLNYFAYYIDNDSKLCYIADINDSEFYKCINSDTKENITIEKVIKEEIFKRELIIEYKNKYYKIKMESCGEFSIINKL